MADAIYISSQQHDQPTFKQVLIIFINFFGLFKSIWGHFSNWKLTLRCWEDPLSTEGHSNACYCPVQHKHTNTDGQKGQVLQLSSTHLVQ